VDIVAYLRMLRRHWKIIVAAALLGALLGAASTLATKHASPAARTYYKATHTLFLDTSSINDQVRPIYTNLDQIAVLATTGDVPKAVASKLGGDAGDWTSHIFTVTNGTTNTLDITCAEQSGDDAAACADTFADELIASLRDREQGRFNNERDSTLQRIDSLDAQITSLEAQIAAQPADAEVLQAQRRSLVNAYSLAYEKFQQLANQGGPASILTTLQSAEAQPISQDEYDTRIEAGQLGQNRVRADAGLPDSAATDTTGTTARFSGPVSRGILGALLGMMIGIGLAVVSDRVDRRLRTREEVEAAFGLAVLAEVPSLTASQQRHPAILSATAPLSRTAEAYRAVRSSLMFQRATDARHHPADEALVVLVGSAGPKEGKTTTSANLATMFAETGQRVLAINCDFRRPSLHQFFDLPNEPRRVFETSTPGLWVVTDVTSGPAGANPAFVVEEQRRLVASARKRFDVIILDTAPMLTTNDATEVMTSADLAVIVSRSGVTTSDGAQRTRELLSRIAAPVSGVVLLGSEASPNDYYYYYSRSRAQQLADIDVEPTTPETEVVEHALFDGAAETGRDEAADTASDVNADDATDGAADPADPALTTPTPEQRPPS
jgi:capsular exopolysaccharide synthesis family protein